MESVDVDCARNALFDVLGLSGQVSNRGDNICHLSSVIRHLSPDTLLAPVLSYAVGNGVTDEAGAERFSDRLMGLLTPAPSAVIRRFNSFADKREACDDFYAFCIANNYIKKSAVDKNIGWRDGRWGIEITINLSKPEKNNKEIAAAAEKPAGDKYPKCLLCAENVGFAGSASHPARQNLRTIPVTLGGEDWFWQFSPYVYYDQHCICVNCVHRNMCVEPATLDRLADFVSLYPGYFMGCNASLPIIGGSILNHDHFQGGGAPMPMFASALVKSYRHASYPAVEYARLGWYNSALKLTSCNRGELLSAGGEIIQKWRAYDDSSAGIFSSTDGTPHNSLAPVMRMEDGRYALYMILRNNRTDAEHSDGIFHAHREYHNIKSEGIGLIEAMGLFILPARLQRQGGEIEGYLRGEPFMPDKLAPDMLIHAPMIRRLIAAHGTCNAPAAAEQILRGEIGTVCRNILVNTAVFKPDAAGEAAFERFVAAAGLE